MRRSLILLAGALIVALLLPATVAAAKPAAPTPVTAPVTGTTADGGTVTGIIEITRFASRGGDLTAIGTFTGTVTDAAGNATTGSQRIALPVDVAAATCDILNLVLGPLHLDLLGLVVDLNQVELNITAEQGPGNLLGNLLCAVAGLLDPGGGGPLAAITALLNQILGILQGL